MTKNFLDFRYLITAPEQAERQREVTLVDLRPAEDFAVGHIAGSTHERKVPESISFFKNFGVD